MAASKFGSKPFPESRTIHVLPDQPESPNTQVRTRDMHERSIAFTSLH